MMLWSKFRWQHFKTKNCETTKKHLQATGISIPPGKHMQIVGLQALMLNHSIEMAFQAQILPGSEGKAKAFFKSLEVQVACRIKL